MCRAGGILEHSISDVDRGRDSLQPHTRSHEKWASIHNRKESKSTLNFPKDIDGQISVDCVSFRDLFNELKGWRWKSQRRSKKSAKSGEILFRSPLSMQGTTPVWGWSGWFNRGWNRIKNLNWVIIRTSQMELHHDRSRRRAFWLQDSSVSLQLRDSAGFSPNFPPCVEWLLSIRTD